MPAISWTKQQRTAIETVGTSVLVSAAAGSGKTAVLAERCAYLVCDAPPEQRCDIDQLLVLTFTEAAAAEMRSRIVEAIRTRAAQQPNDPRLREQASRADAAHISTLHAFCLWMIRRWFSELGVDPAASLLDADEAVLLRKDVLRATFDGLYQVEAKTAELPTEGAVPVETEPARAFVKLVDDYGLGDDRAIVALVLRLADFVVSLPDPEGWLVEARDSVMQHPEQTVLALMDELGAELALQAEECDSLREFFKSLGEPARFYLAQFEEYAKQLHTWLAQFQSARAVSGTEPDPTRTLARLSEVLERIGGWEFTTKKAPALSRDDQASALLSHVKKRLWSERLKDRFCAFSVQHWLENLAKTAPYVATLTRLVESFGSAYATEKRRLCVLDFSDLEQLAFRLLHEPNDPERPSSAARMLHHRFVHVLVDEFQDINPIQQSILRLLSRESDAKRPDNLFAVGDVKQSIYRFRLAEPRLFTQRLARFRDGSSGQAVFLQSNFRSRAAILDGVNTLFKMLMRQGTGDVVYDAEAELRPGRPHDAGQEHPIELHVLEKKLLSSASGDETDESADEEPSEAGAWTPMEREAYLIGSRIREWVGGARYGLEGKPLCFGDVVVLLRAAKVNAGLICQVLSAMGIPAYSEVGGSLLKALEIKDVLAALQLLDNAQQDIPLASVMRSGVLGFVLDEDQLVSIRMIDRDIPFHEAVRRYAAMGNDAELRQRVAQLLQLVDAYRRELFSQPLSEVLWKLYERHGYLAYAGGLPRGAQRQANLIKLHELSRKFGTFHRQGLHRFMHFLESMEEQEQSIVAAPPFGEGENVVRIMSIHHSKGLEFPVVFVAGLGTKFNLDDIKGRMIFDRRHHLGLRVVNPELLKEYPSAAHTLVGLELERKSREEELRILYVAMTRAKEKLVLVGSTHNVGAALRLCGLANSGARDSADPSASGGAAHPSRLSVLSARTPLDWITAALPYAPQGTVSHANKGGTANQRLAVDSSAAENSPRVSQFTPLFEVHIHESEEMSAWSLEQQPSADNQSVLRAVASRQPLPESEPINHNDSEAEQVRSRINYVYPWLASTALHATVGASAFKDARDSSIDHRQQPTGWPATLDNSRGLDRGILTHRILQHLDFSIARDAAGVNLELQRMIALGLFREEDRSLLDEESLIWFVGQPLAEAIRAAGPAYRREFSYLAAESPQWFDATIGPSPDDFILVRGIVDGILPKSAALEVIDFKTDAITENEVASRAERYRPQAALYARAVASMWRQPVTSTWLVFLTPRILVEWKNVHESK